MPAIVRVHLHMGSDLPAADENGLLDPYCRIGFRDCPRHETHKQYDTRDPLLHQSFDFDTVLRSDLAVAPVSQLALDARDPTRATLAFSRI